MNEQKQHDYQLPQGDATRHIIPKGNWFRAVIFDEDGKQVAAMRGKYNTREQLEAWLKENWPADNLKYNRVEMWQSALELKVWQYGFPCTRIVTHARTAK